jgi:hypothetical protein
MQVDFGVAAFWCGVWQLIFPHCKPKLFRCLRVSWDPQEATRVRCWRRAF